jgi:hypothetical protein
MWGGGSAWVDGSVWVGVGVDVGADVGVDVRVYNGLESDKGLLPVTATASLFCSLQSPV